MDFREIISKISKCSFCQENLGKLLLQRTFLDFVIDKYEGKTYFEHCYVEKTKKKTKAFVIKLLKIDETFIISKIKLKKILLYQISQKFLEMHPKQLNSPENIKSKWKHSLEKSNGESSPVRNIFLNVQSDCETKRQHRMKLPKLRQHREKMKKNWLKVFPKLQNSIQDEIDNQEQQFKNEASKKQKDNLIRLSQRGSKKTCLLNSIIQILQNKNPNSIDRQRARKPWQNLIASSSYHNEFLEEINPTALHSSQKPRVIENNIIKLHNNHANLNQRKIFSEEKGRKRISEGSFDFDQQITFYKPKTHKQKAIKETNQFFL